MELDRTLSGERKNQDSSHRSAQTAYRLLRAIAVQIVATMIGCLDHVIPKDQSIVLRTLTYFDDQGLELVRSLSHIGHTNIVWIAAPEYAAHSVPKGIRTRSARTPSGLHAYLRASLVIHTHGLGAWCRRPSKRKAFLNVWHGMPIKRLELKTRAQLADTTMTIATSRVHALHLGQTWGLRQGCIAVTGLPRNDVLVRCGSQRRGDHLKRLAGARPIVVWLPTYRIPVFGVEAVDGLDSGNVFQLPDATLHSVNEIMQDLGLFLIVKPHPMATQARSEELSNLAVLSEASLGAAGVSLYRLLADSSVLVTDYSSVWVDYLLLDRPMVFAIADIDEYMTTRGFYFSDIPDLVPGPVVHNLEGLKNALGALRDGQDPWAFKRSASRGYHHEYIDGASGRRVAELAKWLVSGKRCDNAPYADPER